jgi:transposase, IS5 family
MLIGIAEEVVASAKTALEKTVTMRGKDLFAAMTIDAIRDEIARYCRLGEQVIDQARRRVLDGEQVPNVEKIYSIFEPHTNVTKRGKVRTPVEFGHKVFLAESAKGLITQYEVLKGNPVDEVHVAPSLKRHRRAFRRAPEFYGADRGFFSEQNVTACMQGAVKTICIPQRGGSKTPQRQAYERTAAFKQGQRFRAGIEGRISVLMRERGMKRCRAEGAERFALFVGAAVLANNPMIVAALLAKRCSRRYATAIKKGAAEFRVPALRCYVRGRMALARPRPSITPHRKGSRLQHAKGGRGSPLRGLLELT